MNESNAQCTRVPILVEELGSGNRNIKDIFTIWYVILMEGSDVNDISDATG